ncbi:MAG: LysM peptidoglycan-binding domain-containing protein [Pseudomonadota bacterium]
MRNKTWYSATVLALSTLLLLAGCAVKENPASAFGNQLGAVEYVVKKGDNLVLIAAEITRQQENWRRIADFNRIDNPATIRVGQKIWIPKDLIPLDNDAREVAGHPDAVVNSVQLPDRIDPDN